MNTFSVSEVISKAFDFAKNNLVYIAVFLVIGCIPQISTQLGGGEEISQSDINQMQYVIKNGDIESTMLLYGNMMAKSYSTVTIILGLICWIIQTGLYAGANNSLIRVMRGEDSAFSIDAFKMPMNVYVNYILTSIVVGLITCAGTFLCIIPGIFLGIKLMYAPMAILNNKELSVIEAIKFSWNITDNNFWNLFLLCLAIIGISIVGLLCCCIGILFTNVIAQAAVVIAFLAIVGTSTAAQNNLYSASDED